MTEHEQPGGRQNGRPSNEVRAFPTSPEVHRNRFEVLAGAFNRGELARQNEDGSTTTVVSYERHIDPLDRNDLGLLSEFRLRTAAAGFREAFSPLVLPTAAVVTPRESVSVTREGAPGRPLTVVQLGYEKPAEKASSSPTQR